ncbi:MAG: methylenetetrahydrofolate reductase [Actinobacteria bacterium]|nr:methylenetetrahydrofolate reductase [Actinomycetota bacterium]
MTSTTKNQSTQHNLIANARFEVVPLKNLEAQIEHIPASASVSVTCSPAKGLQATLDLTARLIDLGHKAVPHISARLVEDDVGVKSIAEYCNSHGIDEVFLVAGDSPQPVGEYHDVMQFLRDFLATEHGVSRIGITAYPDGHALIDAKLIHEALHAKQALLAEAGVAGFASTQMCFDVDKWRSWATAERAAGFTLPLHIGVPGAIDRAKLLSMGVRLGIGASLRYVHKNSGILGLMFGPGRYDPNKLIAPLAAQADEFKIDGVHLFTFNNVQATAEWQQKTLAKLT